MKNLAGEPITIDEEMLLQKLKDSFEFEKN